MNNVLNILISNSFENSFEYISNFYYKDFIPENIIRMIMLINFQLFNDNLSNFMLAFISLNKKQYDEIFNICIEHLNDHTYYRIANIMITQRNINQDQFNKLVDICIPKIFDEHSDGNEQEKLENNESGLQYLNLLLKPTTSMTHPNTNFLFQELIKKLSNEKFYQISLVGISSMTNSHFTYNPTYNPIDIKDILNKLNIQTDNLTKISFNQSIQLQKELEKLPQFIKTTEKPKTISPKKPATETNPEKLIKALELAATLNI